MYRWFVRSLVVVALLGSWPGHAAAETVLFESEPKGARVCLKKKGVLECLGSTPLKLGIEFGGENDSKRYFFKKIGFQTETRLVTAADRTVRVPLKRRDILFDPELQSSDDLKRLQGSINAVLTRLVYEPGEVLGGLDAEFVGHIRVGMSEQRTVLNVGMLLTNNERQKRIGAIRRQHENESRDREIACAALQGEGVRVLAVLGDALRSVNGINDIALSIEYPKSSAILTDESVHFLKTYQTGYSERITNQGRTRELITEYTTVKHNMEVTAVEDRLDISTVMVFAPLETAGKQRLESPDVDGIIRSTTVYLNDNRRKTFKQIAAE